MKREHIVGFGVVCGVLVLLAVVFVTAFLAFNVGVSMNTNSIEVSWSAFNTSIAVLEIYIVVFTIGISLLGFIGYNGVKESANKIAKDSAQKAISEYHNKLEEMKKKLDEYSDIIQEKLEKKMKDIVRQEMLRHTLKKGS